MNIFKKIPAIMSELGAVSKGRRNEQQGYAFRGIEDLYNALNPILAKHSVFCVPQVVETTREKHEKKKFDRGQESIQISFHVTHRVCHKFYADDGSFVDVITVGEGLDTSDKASNKALSGAMKYAFIELFSIPTEDIEDADRSTPELDPSGEFAQFEERKPLPAPPQVTPTRTPITGFVNNRMPIKSGGSR